MPTQARAQSRPQAARFQEILHGLAQAAREDFASARDAFIRNYLAASGRGSPLEEGQTDAERQAAAGLSLAGLAGGGGMAVGTSGPSRGEAIGMFLGRKAKHPLARTVARWKEGEPMPPGTVMGPDGRPRIEISDVKAAPLEGIYHQAANEVALPKGPTSLNEILRHDDLLKAYPNLAGIHVYPFSAVRPRPISAPGAMYVEPKINPMGTTSMYPEEIIIENLLPRELFLKRILHELQHAVQYREGFPQGTSPTAAMSSIRDSLSEMKRAHISQTNELPEYVRRLDTDANVKDLARLMYARNLGEQEARAVSNRRLMTQSELAQTPPTYLPQITPETLIHDTGKSIDNLLRSIRKE